MTVAELILLLSKEEQDKDVIFDITKLKSDIGDYVYVDGVCVITDPGSKRYVSVFSDLLKETKE